jgi:hypothetical protein
MKKYFITNRPSGLGDILCNLAATYFFAKKYGGNVIIDWRHNMYNKGINYEYKSHVLPNLFSSIFLQPESINGVDFLMPESDPTYYYNMVPMTCLPVNYNKLNGSQLDDLKKDLYSKIESNNYIKVEQRILENNQIFKELLQCNFPIQNNDGVLLENFEYDSFLSNFKLQKNLHKKINDFYDDNFKGHRVIGIQMRYGNLKLKEPYFRLFPDDGGPWVDDDTIIKTIEEQLRFVDTQNVKYFICCDNEEINQLILSKFSNSFCYNKTFPEKESCIHLNNEGIPITMIQESFIDMYLLTKCDFLITTGHSVYPIWPICKLTDGWKDFSKIRTIFNDRTK